MVVIACLWLMGKQGKSKQLKDYAWEIGAPDNDAVLGYDGGKLKQVKSDAEVEELHWT